MRRAWQACSLHRGGSLFGCRFFILFCHERQKGGVPSFQSSRDPDPQTFTFFFVVGVNDPLAAPTLDDIRGAIRSLPPSPTFWRGPMVLVATDRVLVLSSWGFVVGTGSSTVSGWEDPQTPMSSNRDRSDANACSVAGEAEEPAPSLAFVKGVDQHAFCGGPATQLSLPTRKQ